MLKQDLDHLREKAQVPNKVREQLEASDEAGFFLTPGLPDYIQDMFPEDQDDPDMQENWTFALARFKTENTGYDRDRMPELNRLKSQGKPIKSFKDRYYLTVYWEEIQHRMTQLVKKTQEELGDYFLPPHKRKTSKLTVTPKLKELIEEQLHPTHRGGFSGAASVAGSDISTTLPSRRAVPTIEGFRHKLPIPPQSVATTSSQPVLESEIEKEFASRLGEKISREEVSNEGMFISSSTPDEDLEAAAYGVQPRVTNLMPDTDLALPVTSKVQGSDVPTVEEFVAGFTNPKNPTSGTVTIDPTYCPHCGSIDGGLCECEKYQCVYPPCMGYKIHSIYLCPTLMSRCGRCMLRGHTEDMCLRYTLHQWMFVYHRYFHMNVLTHDVLNNIALTVYPFPSTIPSNIISALSIILSRTRFFALASRRSLNWVEEEFLNALKSCSRSATIEPLIAQARADIRAAFKHVRDLQAEEQALLEHWESQVNKTLGPHTPFFRPVKWGSHRFYRWFHRVEYSLTCFGMPNYRGPTVWYYT